MATQLRDTQFGHLLRHLTHNRLLPYPDELSPSNAHQSLLEKGDNQITTGNGTEEEGEVQSLIVLVDWYGADDPENPQNWSRGWKLLVCFQICLVNFSVYIASSVYVPGMTNIREEFGAGETVAILGLSLYTVGYGLGPMFWSPLSEVPRLGRTGIYFWTLLGFVLLQLPTGLATNMEMFLVFRPLTGFVGSPSLATGGATIADMYEPAKVAYGICIWGAFGVCGPVFGPIVGGYVAPAKGWRWTIWVVAWLCGVVVVLVFFLLPETSATNILYRRARRLRLSTGDERLRSQSEIDTADHTWKDNLVTLGRAFTLTFAEPIVFFMDLYTALVYGLFFTWFESFPLVFGGIYRFGPGAQGLVFLGIFVGGIVTIPFYLLWIRRSVVPRFSKPDFRPELLLPPTFVGAAAIPICLFWYGWSARETLHWMMPVVGSSFFTIGIVTLFNSVLNYLGISYPRYAASIFAGNALFRASFGAAFPLFAKQLFQKLGVGPGNSLLGGIAICFMVIPYLFYQYGYKIRHLSKNARHDV